MKKIIRLTESQLIGVIKRVISEESEHVKNLYKSWANKKSGNPEEALKLMDDVFKYQKQLSKKDFAQYSSYEELKKDIDKIKQPKASEDITEFYRGDIKKGDDLVVIAANTWEASCNYGSSSIWCTTMKNDESYWRRHNQTGTEFFWIFRNKPQDDPNHKFSYHIKVGKGEPDWCNAVNNCMSTTRLPENSYPKQHPKYNEIIQKLQDFHNTRDFKKSKNSQEISTIFQENEIMLEDMIYENRDEIMNVLSNYGINQDVKGIFEYAIDNYLNDEAYDHIPDSLSFDDEDYYEVVDDYINELNTYLNNNIDNTFDINMFNELNIHLPFILSSFLVEVYNFNDNEYFNQQMENQNLTIVDVIENLYSNPNWKYQADELLDEVVSVIASDKVYDLAANFVENYKK